jgi:hypothetical protein|tara:strand:- start:3350 stop:3682 length:333 start_codon:yes stop_codon:yes gene_type:complete
MARRKKKIVEKEKEKDEDLDGWKIGDLAWGTAVTGEEVYGEIKTLHPAHQIAGDPPEDLGPAVTMITEPDKKYRCILISTLKEKASMKQVRALARKKARAYASPSKGKKK